MKEKCILKSPKAISFVPSSEGNIRVRTKQPLITDLKCGECFSIALTSTGKVYTWGSNELGQLGNGDDQPSAEPLHVETLKDSISKISCGMKH
jgi:alpha-tubulin suppressor-like RCC1 family protein